LILVCKWLNINACSNSEQYRERNSLQGLEFVSLQTAERNSVLKDEAKSPSRLAQRRSSIIYRNLFNKCPVQISAWTPFVVNKVSYSLKAKFGTVPDYIKNASFQITSNSSSSVILHLTRYGLK
jgi:hypothetical protein